MRDISWWRRGTTSAVSAILLAVLALLLAPGRTNAASGTERIREIAVTFELRMNGSMHVSEKITYDFGNAPDRHGIERFVPVAFDYDDEHNRVYPMSDIRVSSPTGAPADLQVTRDDVTTLRVGDPDETVSGVHTYVIDYDLGGVVNTVPGGQELYWNAVGTEWGVPIERASAVVMGPGVAVQRATCFQGARGSAEPCSWTAANGAVTFKSTRALAPREGLTVVAGFPAGTFPGAAPILKEKWKFSKAFALDPLTGAGSLGVLALLAGGTGLLVARRGRDQRYLGLTPGLGPGVGDSGRTGRVGWRRPPIAVRFTPPERMRVGELGTLIDEHANVQDVTATIIDLAVRGYLRIEEVPTESSDGPDDWDLVRTDKPISGLREYEAELYDSVFENRDRVRLSDLNTTFRADLRAVQTMLYREVTHRGWFRGNPDQVRTRWGGYAIVVLGLGIIGSVLLAVFTRLALIGVATTIAGLIMLVLAWRMPARTAAGTALLAQAQGFRLYLETAEAEQIRFEEGQDVFSRYLPYAIVFGVAQRWADVFARLAASGRALPAPDWYVGYGYGWGMGPFDYHRFGNSVDSLSSRTTSSIAAATPSTSGSSGFSGGFSGGGGGGGGGGSW